MTPYRDHPCNVDSNTLLMLLKEVYNGKNGDNRIKGIQCGKGDMQALHQNYDGDVKSYKWI